MRYTAKKMKENDGLNTQWAVHHGKRYFPSTVTTNQIDAEKQALILSAEWHQRQMELIHDALVAKGHLEPGYLVVHWDAEG